MSVAKNLLIGTAIATGVAVATVFALAPMYTGGMIEQDFRSNMARASASAPNGMHVTVESYQRGWRSSTAVTHWQIPDSKVDFRLQHHIEHGPSPQYALARIETTAVIPADAQARVQRFFKGSPLTATTLIGKDGMATTTIVSPAFAPTATEDPNVQLGWGGLNAVLTQQGDVFQLRGDVPSLTVNNASKHEQMTLRALHMEGDTKVAGNSLPLVGSGAIALGAMDVVTAETGNFKMGATRLTSRQDERGDLLDMQFTFSNDGMSSSGGTKPPFKVTKVDLDYRFRNLDKAAYQKYQAQMEQLFSTAGDKQTVAAAALPRTMAAASELLHAVAARSPVIEIPKFHIALDQGAVDGTLTATFNGSGLATWPPAMDEAMKRATVNATLRAPEALLRMVAESKAHESAKQTLAAQNMEANDTNIRAVSANIVDQQMQMLAQSPYVKREGNDFSSTLTMQNGEIKINGQSLGNMAAMGFGGAAVPGANGEGMPPMPAGVPAMPTPAGN